VPTDVNTDRHNATNVTEDNAKAARLEPTDLHPHLSEGDPTPVTDAHGGDQAVGRHEAQDDGADATAALDPAPTDGDSLSRRRGRRFLAAGLRPVGAAALFGSLSLIAIAGLCGWLGWQVHRQQAADHQRAVYLQAGRQGALNLTTIDWQHADADVQRILDSSAGTFRDDFSTRAMDFIGVVKETHSHTEGSVTEAGLESETATGAHVLVAVNVKTTQAGQTQQSNRGWRMRISVERVGDTVKVSNVEFVP
jgi:Mce-associated membrane protein